VSQRVKGRPTSKKAPKTGLRSLPAAIDQFLPGGGAGVALHGMPSLAQVPGDRADSMAVGE
jgi:hypothetical protein